MNLPYSRCSLLACVAITALMSSGGCSSQQAPVQSSSSHQPSAEPKGASEAKSEAKSPSWTVQFGTAEDDSVMDVSVDRTGNILIAGYTKSALGNQKHAGATDSFVCKLDPKKEFLWTHQFGTSGRDLVQSLVANADGSVIIVGNTEGTLTEQANAGERDAFVRKLDSSGTVLWTKQFGGGSDDWASKTSLDNGGNLVVVGSTKGAFPGQQHLGKVDVFIMKLDGDGKVQWTQQFGTSEDDYGASVTTDASGNIVAVVNSDAKTTEAPGGQLAGAVVRKLDGNGKVLWTTQLGAAGQTSVNEVGTDTKGNILVTGSISDEELNKDVLVWKLDGNGKVLWKQKFGTDGPDSPTAIGTDGDGNTYVAGSTYGVLSGEKVSGEDLDIFIRIFDAAGKELTTEQLISKIGVNDEANAMHIDPQGHVTLAGYTEGAMGGINAGRLDAFVHRMAGGD